MTKAVILALTLLALPAGPLNAQTLPFDMTPERPASDSPAVTAPPEGEGNGAAGSQPVTVAPVAEPVETVPFQRYILPEGSLGLTGEFEDRLWSVYLTAQQAASGAKLNLGYQNSIFVAPETSRLTVEVNNTKIAEEAIRSPESVSDLSLDLPKDLLKPGSNLIRLRSSQRHRTDCDVQSTYELWSNVDAEKTFLSFTGNDPVSMQSLDDIKAIGVDEGGLTRFNFVVPALKQPVLDDTIDAPVAGLGGPGRYAEPVLFFRNEQTYALRAGRDDGPRRHQCRAFAAAGLLARWRGHRAGGRLRSGHQNRVAGSGDHRPDMAGDPQCNREHRCADRCVPCLHAAMSSTTQRWRSPDAPFLFSNSRLPFSQLGLKTEEFSGRRFRTDFTIGVPSDFYAASYGEAVILLDAAYSSAVLPGSHIDIYVNDSIASTVPITSSGGGLLRHLPINVTMRHFRPGVNTIAIEAILSTESDKVCAPGATGTDAPRFALFDTSEFHMPDFARVGQLPNLAATAGTGAPYNRTPDPVPLFPGPDRYQHAFGGGDIPWTACCIRPDTRFPSKRSHRRH